MLTYSTRTLSVCRFAAPSAAICFQLETAKHAMGWENRALPKATRWRPLRRSTCCSWTCESCRHCVSQFVLCIRDAQCILLTLVFDQQGGRHRMHRCSCRSTRSLWRAHVGCHLLCVLCGSEICWVPDYFAIVWDPIFSFLSSYCISTIVDHVTV